MTRSIYSKELPTKMQFGKSGGCDRGYALINLINAKVDELTTMNEMFDNCINMVSCNTEGWNTSKVTDMSATFADCRNLTSLDVSNWDTSNVTNMSSTFAACINLTSLDVSNFDTSNVTNMFAMFNGCNKLTTIDVSNFDTSNVTVMYSMFYNCQSLTSLDVSNWDTSNVTNMGCMFNDSKKITTIKGIESLNVKKVVDFNRMFDSCYELTSLDLSNWDISNVTNMNNMFSDDNYKSLMKLKTLNLSNWKFNENIVMTDLFLNSINLDEIIMNNSDYNSINKIIVQLLTRTADNMGTLNIAGVDDYNQVNITTAESKNWNVIYE